MDDIATILGVKPAEPEQWYYWVILRDEDDYDRTRWWGGHATGPVQAVDFARKAIAQEWFDELHPNDQEELNLDDAPYMEELSVAKSRSPIYEGYWPVEQA